MTKYHCVCCAAGAKQAAQAHARGRREGLEEAAGFAAAGCPSSGCVQPYCQWHGMANGIRALATKDDLAELGELPEPDMDEETEPKEPGGSVRG